MSALPKLEWGSNRYREKVEASEESSTSDQRARALPCRFLQQQAARCTPGDAEHRFVGAAAAGASVDGLQMSTLQSTFPATGVPVARRGLPESEIRAPHALERLRANTGRLPDFRCQPIWPTPGSTESAELGGGPT